LEKFIPLQTPSPNGASFQLLLLLAILIPAILFLLTQYNTLRTIRKPNRVMAPGLVWLQLIPGVGQIWQFFVVANISASIRKEYSFTQDDSILGLPNAEVVEELGKRPTFAVGITYCILFTTAIIINLSVSQESRFLPVVGGLFSLSGMTCWIIYWVQLGAYKRKLKGLHGRI
jgi:hypothetical protein